MLLPPDSSATTRAIVRQLNGRAAGLVAYSRPQLTIRIKSLYRELADLYTEDVTAFEDYPAEGVLVDIATDLISFLSTFDQDQRESSMRTLKYHWQPDPQDDSISDLLFWLGEDAATLTPNDYYLAFSALQKCIRLIGNDPEYVNQLSLVEAA